MDKTEPFFCVKAILSLHLVELDNKWCRNMLVWSGYGCLILSLTPQWYLLVRCIWQSRWH